eukprot:scaffold21059_cov114-Skeletonema_dohrnii-CCMP3373.AAC.1
MAINSCWRCKILGYGRIEPCYNVVGDLTRSIMLAFLGVSAPAQFCAFSRVSEMNAAKQTI